MDNPQPNLRLIERWLLPGEQAEILGYLGRYRPKRPPGRDECLRELTRVAKKVENWFGPSWWNQRDSHIRWTCLFLDLLTEWDEFTRWYDKRSPVVLPENQPTMKDLRDKFNLLASENNLERSKDPEWHIFDPDMQALGLSFLNATPYQQWKACNGPLAGIEELFKEQLFKMSRQGSGGEYLSREAHKLWVNAAHHWYTAWEAGNLSPETEDPPRAFLLKEDGQAELLEGPPDTFSDRTRLAALCESNSNLLRLVLVFTPERRILAMAYAPRRWEPRPNERATQMLGQSVEGPCVVLSPNLAPRTDDGLVGYGT